MIASCLNENKKLRWKWSAPLCRLQCLCCTVSSGKYITVQHAALPEGFWGETDWVQSYFLHLRDGWSYLMLCWSAALVCYCWCLLLYSVNIRVTSIESIHNMLNHWIQTCLQPLSFLRWTTRSTLVCAFCKLSCGWIVLTVEFCLFLFNLSYY